MYVCGWSITSGVVDEFAERIPGEHHTDWRVSWLPGRPLTRDQALAAMELVELLYDPARNNEPGTQAAVAEAARAVGIRPIDAAAILSERHPNR
ncbi:hypothetical protein JK358_00005 [Nocardia sp. 2]|uniref:Uncharacterized protein n=1 Tax=Nocardia acididurans TaxID=2802282 RepID=A0ABS1LXB5_9NOCA|nr:hypothetical protein [Nocardia acididurans]MBL1072770.1 hypothetical protein [Nocardia acididurans]